MQTGKELIHWQIEELEMFSIYIDNTRHNPILLQKSSVFLPNQITKNTLIIPVDKVWQIF